MLTLKLINVKPLLKVTILDVLYSTKQFCLLFSESHFIKEAINNKIMTKEGYDN